MSDTHSKASGPDLNNSNWLELVRQQVNSLRFGVVEITIHDSNVTQIEKTERLRLDKSPVERRTNRIQ